MSMLTVVIFLMLDDRLMTVQELTDKVDQKVQAIDVFCLTPATKDQLNEFRELVGRPLNDDLRLLSNLLGCRPNYYKFSLVNPKDPSNSSLEFEGIFPLLDIKFYRDQLRTSELDRKYLPLCMGDAHSMIALNVQDGSIAYLFPGDVTLGFGPVWRYKNLDDFLKHMRADNSEYANEQSEICRAVIANDLDYFRKTLSVQRINSFGSKRTEDKVELTECPLGYAVSLQRRRMVKRLLELGADPHLQKPGPKDDPLYITYNLEILKMFENYQPDYNVRTLAGGGGTMLHFLASLNRDADVELVKYLVSRGIDTSIKDAEGRTAYELTKPDCAFRTLIKPK